MTGPRAIPEPDRFWPKVDASGVCWEWAGATVRGYGRFGRGPEYGNAVVQAHRWAWEHLVGPIPEDLVLDHLCRNTVCVNPDHLEPVTIGDNVRRGRSAKREQTHCKQGHPFTEENTYRRSEGGRKCRTCNSEAGKRFRRRNAGVAVAVLTAAALLLTACGNDGYEQGPAGQVVAKDKDRDCHTSWSGTGKKRRSHESCTTEYELTTRDKQGQDHEFEVSYGVYDNCYRGSAYPRCANR